MVTWTPPTDNGGSPITGYVVTPYVNGTPGSPQTFNTTDTTETVTGLTDGTTYTFTVAAVTANGVGEASDFSASVQIGGPPPNLPEAPTPLLLLLGPAVLVIGGVLIARRRRRRVAA